MLSVQPPILHRLKKEYPFSYITWISDYPELLPVQVDEKIKFSDRTVSWIATRTFDICLNLDKDHEAIAIIERLMCEHKYGFGMDEYGRACALNPMAEQKLLTGIFNDISKQNTKSYPQEIFEIYGYRFEGEKYIIKNTSTRDFRLDQSRQVIGFNTGCGSRWPSRLWPMEYWQ
jgi:heptosyltransferase-2